ncbi:class I SAM-dependent methyltransferase [Ruminococcus sp.]|uniref:class I SAM-dependent methyltransferase n=1 Tax=Ruminococcus sp. TaxID=41978 RepID=UPI0025FDADDF|nr:class I SAM-dependent methyltransferase [Ruminococcus sp.]
MSFTDNFGNPKGLLGRMMLTTMDKEHLPMAQWALKQIKIPDNGKVADIGCGGGYNIRRMLEMSSKARFIGLDISDESVKKAEKVNKAEIGKRVKIIKGSAEKLPFKENSIDLITAFETVFFWKKPEKGFKEVHRTLVKDGCFAVINNYGDPNVDWEKKVPCMTRYTAEQIADMLKKVGFFDISVNKKDNLFLVMGYKK